MTELLICTKCRAAQPIEADAQDDVRPGQRLLEALEGAHLPEGVTVTGVECLSNCSRGCTVAMRGPDRWTYIYGNLSHHEHLDAVLEGVGKYHDSADGMVPWRERPEHFKRNCIARIPPLSLPDSNEKAPS